MSTSTSFRPWSATTARIRALFAATALATASAASQAVTFTGPATIAYSGDIEFLTPEMGVLDAPNGMTLRGDYRADGDGFLIASRPFRIGPLPERIDSFANENFKIVLAGGPSGAPGDGELAARVSYLIEPDPLGPVWPNAAAGGEAHLVGNGLLVHTLGVAEVFDDVLPSGRILAPGQYALRTIVALNFTPGTPGAYPVAGFIELGGMSNFNGVDLSIIGVPVPEPANLVLFMVGAGVVAERLRRQRGRKLIVRTVEGGGNGNA